MLLPLDLETTGLEPTHDRILEVGWTLVQDDLRNITEDGIRIQRVTPDEPTWDILNMNQFVHNMHTISGLVKDLSDGPTLKLAEVEDKILADIDSQPPEDIYLMGASVHFDRSFIDYWMPRLAERLHHRIYDTSSLKLAMERYVQLSDKILNLHPHRADYDVAETLLYSRLLDKNVRFAGFALSAMPDTIVEKLEESFDRFDLGYGFLKEGTAGDIG